MELTKDNYKKYKDLSIFPADQLVEFFSTIPKIQVLRFLRKFDPAILAKLMEEWPSELSSQWKMGLEYEENTVGELMQPAALVLNENQTIADAIAEVKEIPQEILFTYGMVVDDSQRVTGVLVFKDIFYYESSALMKDICFKNAICLKATDDIFATFNDIAGKQIPEFPVVDDDGKLLGTLRGNHVNDAHAMQLRAQSGLMVGVSNEEGLESSIFSCVKMRGPWLLVNLITAFIAGAVVGVFQDTIDKIVLLALFLPILAGQSGNTGAQALAVLIRELALGDIGPKMAGQLSKEVALGLIHGLLTGAICAAAMYFLATQQGNTHAFALSLIILVALTVSCIISGLMGAFVPVVLKKFGADPAAASSIFLTTGTDVVSMGVMLGLAAHFIAGP